MQGFDVHKQVALLISGCTPGQVAPYMAQLRRFIKKKRAANKKKGVRKVEAETAAGPDAEPAATQQTKVWTAFTFSELWGHWTQDDDGGMG